MVMQHITLSTPCIAFMLVSHTCIFVIDHAEQGQEEPPEPAQVEDTNPEQALVHLTLSLSFIYNFILIMILGCTLGYTS
jgi:hypothetical protein